MAEVLSAENKEWLSKALFYLGKPTSGSQEGDIALLSASIQQYVIAY